MLPLHHLPYPPSECALLCAIAAQNGQNVRQSYLSTFWRPRKAVADFDSEDGHTLCYHVKITCLKKLTGRQEKKEKIIPCKDNTRHPSRKEWCE